MGLVRLGYFEGFKSGNTLLLDGDQEGLQQLGETLQQLASGGAEAVALHSLPFVEAHHGVRLVARVAPRDTGTLQGAGTEFEWKRTSSGWEEAAEKVAVISQSRCGHHYLDAFKDEVTVMVSLGEYGSQWWDKNG